jgi:hypothetical protein
MISNINHKKKKLINAVKNFQAIMKVVNLRANNNNNNKKNINNKNKKLIIIKPFQKLLKKFEQL